MCVCCTRSMDGGDGVDSRDHHPAFSVLRDDAFPAFGMSSGSLPSIPIGRPADVVHTRPLNQIGTPARLVVRTLRGTLLAASDFYWQAPIRRRLHRLGLVRPTCIQRVCLLLFALWFITSRRDSVWSVSANSRSISRDLDRTTASKMGLRMMLLQSVARKSMHV